MKKFYLLIGFYLLIVGCQNSKNNSYKLAIYEVYIDDAINTSYSLSYIVDSIEYIYLQTPLGGITTFDISDNYFLLKDRDNRVMLFYSDGRFVTQIGREGRGHADYSGLVYNVLLDEKSNAVYILTQSKGQIMKYDLKGNFVTKIIIGHDADFLGLIEQGIIIVHIANWTGNKENSYVVINDKGEVLKEFKNHYKYTLNKRVAYKKEGVKYIYNNNLYVKDKGDTLFMVSKDQLIPKFIFKSKCSIQESDRLTQEQYDEAIDFLSAFETDHILYFCFQSCIKNNGNSPIKHGFFDKKTGKTFLFQHEKNAIYDHYIKNDIDDENYFHWVQKKGYLMAPRFDFDEDKLSKVKPEIAKKIRYFRSRINDEDPAFMAIMHLKK